MLQLMCRSCSISLYIMVITFNVTATSGIQVKLYTLKWMNGDIFWHFYHLQAISLYIYINLKELIHASLRAVICFIQSGL